MKEKFPRVTQIQVDLWLNDPVTKAYLTCFSEVSRGISEQLSDCKFIDSANNDSSMNKMHSLFGQRSGINYVSDSLGLLQSCEMITPTKPKEEEDGKAL
jgi:hypothetical protein